MPRSITHFVVGCAVGAGVSYLLQKRRIKEGDLKSTSWGELLVSAVAAGGAAVLPDILEPATSPNHRGFFHSLTAALIVSLSISGRHVQRLPVSVRLILFAAGCGYLSHLALDGTTPMGIEII